MQAVFIDRSSKGQVGNRWDGACDKDSTENVDNCTRTTQSSCRGQGLASLGKLTGNGKACFKCNF